jgi:PAS domain S-box-containing protein
MVVSSLILPVTLSMGAYAAIQYQRLDRRPELLAFVCFMSGLSLWLLIDIFINAVTSPELKLFGGNMINAVALWIVLFSILWFAVAYSGNDRLVNKWTSGAAILVIILHACLCISNPEFLYTAEGLATQGPMTVFGFEFGQWVALERTPKLPYRVLLLIGYFLALLSGGVLCRYLIRNRSDVSVGLTVVLVTGISVPIVANAPVFAGILPPRLNPIELSFGVTAVSFGLATFRYRLLQVAPAGRRQLVETMTDPVVMIDRTGTVVDSNAAARDLVDAPPDWRGLDAQEFWAPFPEEYERFRNQNIATARVSSEKDGQTRHFDLNVSPITDNNGPVAGYTVVLREITELKRREQDLKETQAELKQTVERLDQFNGMISHDLRNPLNSAQSRVELIGETEHTEHLKAVMRNLDRMESMIDDLHALSQTGIAADEFESVALADVIAESWTRVTTEQTDLSVDLPESLVVDASRGHLQLVFENLLDNAITHNSGEVSVRIGLLNQNERTGPSAAHGFFIEDDGKGVPEEIRGEMFEYGRTTSSEGSGFGLSIVKEVIDMHGWHIVVTEGDHGGARFEVTGVDFDT